ncbi:uncharacterized protein BDW70DRAFT_142741 [Aspergillus foveolatus]|uniref:uncharacterized protein n=1 Tax=Aspergillus foveolatus TaxID=210207 RepID=UPI003CCDF3F6
MLNNRELNSPNDCDGKIEDPQVTFLYAGLGFWLLGSQWLGVGSKQAVGLSFRSASHS